MENLENLYQTLLDQTIKNLKNRNWVHGNPEIIPFNTVFSLFFKNFLLNQDPKIDPFVLDGFLKGLFSFHILNNIKAYRSPVAANFFCDFSYDYPYDLWVETLEWCFSKIYYENCFDSLNKVDLDGIYFIHDFSKANESLLEILEHKKLLGLDKISYSPCREVIEYKVPKFSILNKIAS